MITSMLYDNFAEEYVLKTDPYAPPERNLLTKRSETEFYQVTWSTTYEGADSFITISYPKDDYYDNKKNFEITKEALKDYPGIRLNQITEWWLPASVFDDYVERFGLKKEE